MASTVYAHKNGLGSFISALETRFPFVIWVLIMASLTLIMRLPMLSTRPLWYDEAFSILFSREGPNAMLYGTLTQVNGAAADVHPLLYYSLLWLWMKLFGQSVLAVRSLSVLLSLALGICLMILGRKLFNRSVALMAGLLYAISPFQIHYGQEARMYILLALLLVCATIFLLQAVRSGSRTQAILFGVCAALAMYSHVLAAFFLLPLVLVFALWHRSRKAWMQITIGVLLALLIYSPWFAQLPSQISKVGQAYWIQRPGFAELVQTNLAFGSDLPIDDRLLPFVLAATLLILVFLGLESWHSIRSNNADLPQGILTLSLSFLPVLLLFGMSQLRPLYIIRGLLPSAVFYLLSISWLITQGRNLSAWTLAVCIGVAFTAGNSSHYHYAGFPYAPFTTMNAYLQENLKGDAVVLHSNKLSMLPAYYDDPSLPHRYLQDLPGSGSDTLALPTQEVLGLFAYSDPVAAVGDAPEVYLVAFEREVSEFQQMGYRELPALTTLKSSYRLRSTTNWGDLLLFRLELSE